ncbi:MAG TPA: hypothetical protein VLC92_12915 [Rhodocyclaceae bacterium]|nr:hypothetical protein [Rhodocyclaceae bacterium]
MQIIGCSNTEKMWRCVLFVTVALAGLTFWLAAYPPMNDLPQHAGQIAVLRDLLLGRSSWVDIVHVNLLTPYLIGYGLALPLSFFVPVVVALKVLLTVSFYAFFIACVWLRKEVGGDAQLDWMFIPGVLGFVCKWGFFTFIVAAPVGVFFLVYALRYATDTGARASIFLFLAGVALFFSHGLLFLMCCAIGFLFLIVRQRSIGVVALRAWPYFLLAMLSGAYFVIGRVTDSVEVVPDFADFYGGWGWGRFSEFLVFPWGDGSDGDIFMPLSILMFLAPFMLRRRLNTENSIVFVPIFVVVAIWILVPSVAIKTSILYQRFSLFIFPFYALIFRTPSLADSPHGLKLERYGPLIMLLACWSFLFIHAQRQLDFARESLGIQKLLSSMEPDQRALSLVVSGFSPAANNGFVYKHYPLWYQAERGGWVDMNFAWFPPQIVRFKKTALPKVKIGFDLVPWKFNWHDHDGRIYKYFIARSFTALPANLLQNDECKTQLLERSGAWYLFERVSCGR